MEMRDIYIRISGLSSAAWTLGTRTTIIGIMQEKMDMCVWMAGIKIDGQYYCFNTSVMRTGWLTESADDDDDENSYYYCRQDGARVTDGSG